MINRRWSIVNSILCFLRTRCPFFHRYSQAITCEQEVRLDVKLFRDFFVSKRSRRLMSEEWQKTDENISIARNCSRLLKWNNPLGIFLGQRFPSPMVGTFHAHGKDLLSELPNSYRAHLSLIWIMGERSGYIRQGLRSADNLRNPWDHNYGKCLRDTMAILPSPRNLL